MLKPLGDRLVVQPLEVKEEMVGGFVLAGASKEATQKAKVVAVGDGLFSLSGERMPLSVEVGQTVLMDKQAGLEVKDGDNTYMIVREADVLAIVED